MREVWVLRLGHRPERDKRITTHVALTARALGARGVMVTTTDPELERGVRDVVDRFGGDFRIETGVRWRPVVRDFDGQVVHLTMYGRHIDEAMGEVGSARVLVVVGAEKVPREMYDLADVNLAVGNQPHSEVAALAVFMDRLSGGEGLRRDFRGRMRVIPMDRGKRVVEDP
ncbi:MAG: tRNA (cytidine(56)-2'-O)-methyltransferase [Methanomassiliicoccales archaeon]